MAVRSTRIKDLGEIIRDILDRLGRLERRTRVVVGTGPTAYVLEVPPTGPNAGKLTARHATTGTVTPLASP